MENKISAEGELKRVVFKTIEWAEDSTRGYLKISRTTVFGRTSLSFFITECKDKQLRLFDNYYLEFMNSDKYTTNINSIEEGMALAQERFNEHCYEILNNILG